MLFKRQVLDRIASGEVDLAFRSWRRPTVKPGTQLRTAVGVVGIDAVDIVDPATITPEDAHRAGFASRDDLLATLTPPTTSRPGERAIFRIELHPAGADPRVALRERTDLTPDELTDIDTRLQRLDRASQHGPWTRGMLELIELRPATRAADLADHAGRPKDAFKADVRKLKNLGLTESLDIGYRLAPRGRAFLDAIRDGRRSAEPLPGQPGSDGVPPQRYSEK